jgi:putative peptide zinc metalloprotease protein
MLIKNNISICSVDKHWVIQNEEGRNFRVNEYAQKLFEILKNNWDYDNALIEFNTSFKSTFSEESFRNVINNTFGGYEILMDDQIDKKPTMVNRYLKLKLLLISPKVAGYLSRIFQPLYEFRTFWILFISFTIINVFASYNVRLDLKSVNYFLFPFIFYPALLFHELGHIGACAKKGLKHGGIGFGFYLIFPVMYADITNVWLADKKSRIIANLAGIFNELLYAFGLFIIGNLFNNITFSFAAIMITTTAFFELNPFGRRDGYWVLSDVSNTPNLLIKSQKLIGEGYRIISKNKSFNWSLKEKLIAIYGLLNFSIIIYFMVYVIVNQWNNLLEFPFALLSAPINLARKNFDFLDQSFLLILTFYILVFNMSFRIINKNLPIWLKKMHQIVATNSIFKKLNI